MRAGRLWAAVVALVGWSLTAPLAGAASNGGPTLSLSVSVGPPTTPVGLSASGYAARETVSILFDSSAIASATTDARGSVSTTVAVPATATPGQHTFAASAPDGSATAPFLVRTDWPQYHLNSEHTGINPYENVLNVGNVPTLGIMWSTALGSPVSEPPVVSDGLIFAITENEKLVALDETTGATRWSATIADVTGTDARLVVAQGRVFVGNPHGSLSAYNEFTGALAWTDMLSPNHQPWPTVVGSTILANAALANGTAAVVALNIADGSVIWQTTLPGMTDADAPAADAKYVVAGGRSGQQTFAFGLDRATGAVLWEDLVGGAGMLAANLSNGVVYGATYDGHIFGITETTGSVALSENIGEYIVSTPVLQGTTLYVSTGVIRAFDVSSGALLWEASAPGIGGAAIANGVLFRGEGYQLSALNLSNHAVIWQEGGPPETGPNLGEPVVVDGHVITITSDGHVLSLTIRTPTSLQLNVSPNPSVYGQTITLTAGVAPSTAGTAPSGSVTFFDGSQSLGSATLQSSGSTYSATLQTASLAPGKHQLTAHYSGDATSAGSASAVVSDVVNRAPTALTANPVLSTGFPTLSARLTDTFNGHPLAGRVVKFIVNGTVQCSSTTDANGVATCSAGVAALKAGGYTVNFAGDTDDAPSSASAGRT